MLLLLYLCLVFLFKFLLSQAAPIASFSLLYTLSHTRKQTEAVNRSISGLYLYWCLCISKCIYLVLSFYINTTPYPLFCVSLSLWFPSASVLVCLCEFYLICLALCLSACFLICFDFSCFVFCLSLSVFFSFSCFHFGVFFYAFKHCCTNRESVSWQLHLKHTKSHRIVISQVFWPLPCQIWPMACCRYITALSTKVIGAN